MHPLIIALLVLFSSCCLLVLLGCCFWCGYNVLCLLELLYPSGSIGLSWEEEFKYPVKVQGLSAPLLEKLPKVTGKDLVMGTDTCAVCMKEIKSDQTARMIPGCNHGFHLQCADTWFVCSTTCPMCRTQIRPEVFVSKESNPC